MHALRDHTEDVNESSFCKEKLGGRRSARASMRAQRFEFDSLFVCAHKSRDRNRGQQRHLRDGQRNRDVTYVADLTVLLV